MKRDLSKKTLTIALLLSIVAIGTMNAANSTTRKPMGQRVAVNKTLFQAVRDGDRKTVSDLIKKEGANVNAMSKQGTPLIIAAKGAAANPEMDSKMAKIVRILLRNGADASLTGHRGMTALMIAAQGGADSTVKALLPNKKVREKTINMRDRQGNSALSYASQAGNESTVKLLLSYREIRPSIGAAIQARIEKIREMIREKRDKLIEAGKIPKQPMIQPVVRPAPVRPVGKIL